MTMSIKGPPTGHIQPAASGPTFEHDGSPGEWRDAESRYRSFASTNGRSQEDIEINVLTAKLEDLNDKVAGAGEFVPEALRREQQQVGNTLAWQISRRDGATKLNEADPRYVQGLPSSDGRDQPAPTNFEQHAFDSGYKSAVATAVQQIQAEARQRGFSIGTEKAGELAMQHLETPAGRAKYAPTWVSIRRRLGLEP